MTPIARTWVKNGAPPLEDLAAVLDIYVVELMRIMQGHAEPSERTIALALNAPSWMFEPSNIVALLNQDLSSCRAL